MFTEFERDKAASSGVMFEDFISAVGVYVYTNEGDYQVSVADVAQAFNTTVELVREAVDGHPWLFLRDSSRANKQNPAMQYIESDGE